MGRRAVSRPASTSARIVDFLQQACTQAEAIANQAQGLPEPQRSEILGQLMRVLREIKVVMMTSTARRS